MLIGSSAPSLLDEAGVARLTDFEVAQLTDGELRTIIRGAAVPLGRKEAIHEHLPHLDRARLEVLVYRIRKIYQTRDTN